MSEATTPNRTFRAGPPPGEVAGRAATAHQIEPAEPSRWLFAVTGVVSVLFGVLVLAYPEPSLRLVGVFLGIDLLIAAAVLLVRGMSRLAADMPGVSSIFAGTLALIAGVLAIRNPGESVVLLALAFAIFIIVVGVLSLAHAVVSSERRTSSLAKGVVLTAAGIVIVSWPGITLGTLTVLAGIALCLQGVLDLVEAFVARPRDTTEAAPRGR